MKVKFTFDVSLEDSLVFEGIYPEELQMDVAEKQEIKDLGAEFLFMLDEETGDLIGETYFVPLDNLKDLEPDEEQLEDGLDDFYGKNYVYCWSTTILPKYQGKGYVKMLKSFLLGYLFTKGYKGILGHAKEGQSIGMNQYFGAEILQKFDSWYGTEATHFLYKKDF